MQAPHDWKPVIIKSPFKGNENSSEEEHSAYLDRCILDCIRRGETPYASHKMIPGALNDSIPEERALGMSAGLGMSEHLLLIGAVPTFYLDYGKSSGMASAEVLYEALGATLEFRHIGKNP